MRRLTILLTVLTFTGFMLAACGGDSGTGPDPGNEANGGNGGEETTTYTVDVAVTPSEAGAVSPSAGDTYEEGETVELTADPNDEYVFSGWTGDVGTSDNPLSLTVDHDYSLTANFEKKNYALTTNTDGEGVIAEEIVQKKDNDYEYGTVVELTAAPTSDWKFVEWQGDLSGTDNPAQITVDSPKEVTAVFEKRSYPLTILTNGQGAVSETVIQQKTTDYEHGTTVELDPTATTGWEFNEWQEDLTGSQTPVQITVTQSTTVVADFELLGEGSRPDFYLAQNGVTIKCEDASVGDSGTVDGVTYAKRSAGNIDAANAPSTCTSGITDMSDMFFGEDTFNGDISHWDVSSVTDMSRMFYGATAFNGNIKNWDVSSVTTMSEMFRDAESFNQDISDWDVSNVESMAGIFWYASSFNQDLNSWDVSSVIDMSYVFANATAFNQDLDNWDVSSVTSMVGLFDGATAFNGDVGSWDVSAVEDMLRMFRNASSFNQDINYNQNTGSWDVSNVESMDSMFKGATDFNQDIADWDVGSVINMRYMFEDASSFNQDISGWCVSQIGTKPTDFDAGAHEDFEGATGKQPDWGTTCSGS